MQQKPATLSSRSSWQFSLRSLFALTAFLATLLAALKTFPSLSFVGGLGFWLVLLMPIWVPVSFCRDASWPAKARPLLALVPVAWYARMARRLWPTGWWQYPLLCKVTLVCGSLVALTCLFFSAKGRRHLVNVPLWIAILVGTISLLRLKG